MIAEKQHSERKEKEKPRKGKEMTESREIEGCAKDWSYDLSNVDEESFDL